MSIRFHLDDSSSFTRLRANLTPRSARFRFDPTSAHLDSTRSFQLHVDWTSISIRMDLDFNSESLRLSLRLHFDPTPVSFQLQVDCRPVSHRCLFDTTFDVNFTSGSLRSHTDITIVSHSIRFRLTSDSLRCRVNLNSISLRSQFDVTSTSLAFERIHLGMSDSVARGP